MKSQKSENNNKRNVIFDNFINAAGKVESYPRNGFERRVMRNITAKPTRADKYFFKRILVPLSSAVLICFAVLIFIFKLNKSDNIKTTNNSVVCFSISYPGAKSIALVGDFNKWQKKTDRMRYVNGQWEICKTLKKGIYYKYAFLVNGKNIINDKKAGHFMDDGFGGKTSAIFVN